MKVNCFKEADQVANGELKSYTYKDLQEGMLLDDRTQILMLMFKRSCKFFKIQNERWFKTMKKFNIS